MGDSRGGTRAQRLRRSETERPLRLVASRRSTSPVSRGRRKQLPSCPACGGGGARRSRVTEGALKPPASSTAASRSPASAAHGGSG
ncbi:hypothetical protein CA607_20270 [Caulobacter vibrioides]|nr:hypothetical protein CA607_20270 [Caulobacter vibrioides]